MTREQPSEFKIEFLSRVKQAREAAGYNQRELARLLGIPQDKYKQYETRSFLPHQFVTAFCLATKVSTDWLFGLPRQTVTRRRPPVFRVRQPGRVVNGSGN